MGRGVIDRSDSLVVGSCLPCFHLSLASPPVQLIKYSSYRAEGAVSSCLGEGDVVLLYPGIHESHIWTPKWTAGFELYGVGKEEWYVCV